MKSNRALFSLIVLAFLIVCSYGYFSRHIDEFRVITTVSFKHIIIMAILLVMFSVLLGLFNKVIIDSYGTKLNFEEWFGTSVVTTMVNNLSPFRGGAFARAVYLKQVHNFSYTDFMATMAATYVILIFSNSLFGLFAIGIIYLNYNIFNSIVLLLFLGISVFTGALLLVPKIPRAENGFILNRISRVANGWYQIKMDKKLLCKILLLTMLATTVNCLIYYVAFNAFSLNMSFVKSIIVAVFAEFSALINITPGSLGITESFVAFSSSLFSITIIQGVISAGLVRAVRMAVILPLGSYYSFRLSRRVHAKKQAGHPEKNGPS